MNNMIFLSIFFVGGLFFSGCTPNIKVPDYSSLNKSIKLVDLKKGNVGETKYKYTSITKFNVKLDEYGYNKTHISPIEGTLSVEKIENNMKYIENVQLTFLTSDILQYKYSSDQCGNSNSTPTIERLNKDGSIDSDTKNIQKNKKTKEILKNFSERKNIYACSEWKVNQIKDEVDYFNTLIAFTVAGKKLTFVPLSIPVKYNGIVTHNKKQYYYFTVDDGKVRIDSAIHNDNVANFKVTAKILVNMENFISENISLVLNGNMWSHGNNYDVEVKNDFVAKF